MCCAVALVPLCGLFGITAAWGADGVPGLTDGKAATGAPETAHGTRDKLGFEPEGKPIRAIEVIGTRTQSVRTIRDVLQVRKKDPYHEAALSEDVQRIFALGAFKDVSVDVAEVTNGVKVTFTVVEKPLLKRLEFRGQKKISRGKLKETITSKEKEPFDETKISDDREKVLTLYHDQGYSEVSVDTYTVTDMASGHVTLTWFIKEGPRVLVRHVTVDGVASFKPKKVRKQIETDRKDVYKDEKFRKDLEKVETFYKDRGYLEVFVSTPVITYEVDAKGRKWMDLLIRVSEGHRYIVGTIAIEGEQVLTKATLMKELHLKSGKLFDHSKLDQALQGMRSLYADRGYLRALVTPDLRRDPERGVADLTLRIVEGGLVYIDRISIEGNHCTKDYVVRRELLVKEGDPFNISKVRRSQERLYNLGFFEDVKIDIHETGKTDKADLIFDVVEQKTGIASLGAGFSSQDGLVGTFQLSQTNLFCRGKRVDLMVEFGARRTNYQISYTEPWFLGHRLSLGVDVFNTKRRRIYTGSALYTEQRVGGGLRVAKPLNDYWTLSPGYTFEQVELNDFSDLKGPDGKFLIPREVAVNTSSITSSGSLGIARDSRDNVFDPSSGSRFSLSWRLSGGPFGGDIAFSKETLNYSWFLPLFWRVVFGANAVAGTVSSFGKTGDVPIYEKFFVGGSESVRGYNFRGEIGPNEGARYMTYANAEIKFPLVSEHGRTILQWAFFYDLGGAWTDISGLRLQPGPGTTQTKGGAGMGIRFKTPVFPIRLDWGYGFNHKAGEEPSQFYFTIGSVF